MKRGADSSFTKPESAKKPRLEKSVDDLILEELEKIDNTGFPDQRRVKAGELLIDAVKNDNLHFVKLLELRCYGQALINALFCAASTSKENIVNYLLGTQIASLNSGVLRVVIAAIGNDHIELAQKYLHQLKFEKDEPRSFYRNINEYATGLYWSLENHYPDFNLSKGIKVAEYFLNHFGDKIPLEDKLIALKRAKKLGVTDKILACCGSEFSEQELVNVLGEEHARVYKASLVLSQKQQMVLHQYSKLETTQQPTEEKDSRVGSKSKRITKK